METGGNKWGSGGRRLTPAPPSHPNSRPLCAHSNLRFSGARRVESGRPDWGKSNNQKWLRNERSVNGRSFSCACVPIVCQIQVSVSGGEHDNSYLSPRTEITAPLSTALADRYKIERHLGEGGMATVYLAPGRV